MKFLFDDYSEQEEANQPPQTSISHPQPRQTVSDSSTLHHCTSRGAEDYVGDIMLMRALQELQKVKAELARLQKHPDANALAPQQGTTHQIAPPPISYISSPPPAAMSAASIAALNRRNLSQRISIRDFQHLEGEDIDRLSRTIIGWNEPMDYYKKETTKKLKDENNVQLTNYRWNQIHSYGRKLWRDYFQGAKDWHFSEIERNSLIALIESDIVEMRWCADSQRARWFLWNIGNKRISKGDPKLQVFHGIISNRIEDEAAGDEDEAEETPRDPYPRKHRMPRPFSAPQSHPSPSTALLLSSSDAAQAEYPSLEAAFEIPNGTDSRSQGLARQAPNQQQREAANQRKSSRKRTAASAVLASDFSEIENTKSMANPAQFTSGYKNKKRNVLTQMNGTASSHSHVQSDIDLSFLDTYDVSQLGLQPDSWGAGLDREQ